MLKKIIVAVTAFLIISIGSFYFLANAEIEIWMRIGASVFFGVVAALVGWVVAGE